MPEGNQFLRGEHLRWCELELVLHARDQAGENRSYLAFVRFSRPGSNVDVHLPDLPPVIIDHKRLGERKGDPIAYGKALWEMLFGSAEMQRVLDTANTNARPNRYALRLRLFIGRDALDLHGIWWETLVDPQTGSPILMREDFVFSRYLGSKADTPVEPEPAHRLRVLYAVANPVDLDQYEVNGRALGKPDMDSQWLAREVSDQLDIVMLGERDPVTLDKLIGRLREGFDIFYLVCHGALVNNQPLLYLEDDSRQTKVVPGDLLVDRLRAIVGQPRLIVLASCQSGGTGAAASVGDDGELAALGPRLMDAGIPALIAMQGNITMRTVQRFMPVLFEQLSIHGQIDRAVAVARDAVREQRDWWMPVLFMRLKSGELWYTPALAPSSPNPGYEWQKLLDDLKANKTVMVLGSGLADDVFGSTREIAREWVEKYNFPMTLQAGDGLPQVAQYLACTYSRNYPRIKLQEYLRYNLDIRHGKLLGDYCVPPGSPDELDVLVREIGSRMRALVREKQLANERAHKLGQFPLPFPDLTELAYTQIARLPVTTYVTTNRNNLLLDSLRAEQRHPEVVVCRWKPTLTMDDAADDEKWPPSVFDTEPDYLPSYDRPLIYHVFGNMKYPNTVVLTEDDYFDFLVGFTRNQGNRHTSMPPHVKMALATHGLVFLGFQFDDWEFRTMFRGVLPHEGAEAGDNHPNVAVQIKPSNEPVHSADEAQTYVQKYFSRHRNIQVFWGKSDEFLTELSKRWRRKNY